MWWYDSWCCFWNQLDTNGCVENKKRIRLNSSWTAASLFKDDGSHCDTPLLYGAMNQCYLDDWTTTKLCDHKLTPQLWSKDILHDRDRWHRCQRVGWKRVHINYNLTGMWRQYHVFLGADAVIMPDVQMQYSEELVWCVIVVTIFAACC